MANLLESSPTLDHRTAWLVLSVVYATNDRPVEFCVLHLVSDAHLCNFRQTLARNQFKLSRLWWADFEQQERPWTRR
jgi:hypothetical protein